MVKQVILPVGSCPSTHTWGPVNMTYGGMTKPYCFNSTYPYAGKLFFKDTAAYCNLIGGRLVEIENAENYLALSE